jgi:2-oxoglutarate dehydrogenase complex dehydrogenase (E1) component-like enzyme
MPFFRCTICQDDGSPIAKDVTVMLAETKRDEWYGTITAAHLTALGSGQRYILHLEDGRKGEFLVRRNTSAGEIERAIAIKGIGLLE